MRQTSVFLVFASMIFAGCNSTKALYKSADSNKNYWTVNAFTLSHCGCTQLFVDNFKNGKHDFEIMYTDDIARKYIYQYNKQGKIIDTVSFLAKTENFEIPFDSLDNQVYRKLREIVDNKDALVYEMKWTDYKGYVKE